MDLILRLTTNETTRPDELGYAVACLVDDLDLSSTGRWSLVVLPERDHHEVQRAIRHRLAEHPALRREQRIITASGQKLQKLLARGWVIEHVQTRTVLGVPISPRVRRPHYHLVKRDC